jgi:hypothetical protein
MSGLRHSLLALAVWACATSAGAAGPPVLQEAARLPVAVPADLLQRQHQALLAMPAATVEYDELGVVRRLDGDTGLYLSDPATTPMVVDHGVAALDVLSPLLLAAGTERLTVRAVQPARKGERVIVYDESIRGVPVKGGLSLAIDVATGRITSLGTRFLPDRELPERATLGAKEAKRALEEALAGSTLAEKGSVEMSGAPRLSYVQSQEDMKPALVWLVDASYTSAREGRQHREFWVNAVTGRVEGWEPLGRSFLYNSYTANGASPNPRNFPSGLVASGDQYAQNAIANLILTEQAWLSFGVTSIGAVGIVVNYGTLPNAGWGKFNSVHWLVFNNGGGDYLPFGNSSDTVAHEYGHGRFYESTFGSLSGGVREQRSIEEAYADLSAVIVDRQKWGGPSFAGYQIAEDVRVSGVAARSWSSPKVPDLSARDWYPLRSIGGDPHLNITIMGHAFYLLSEGGTHYTAGLFGIPVIVVPRIGFDAAARIFYHALGRPAFFNARTFIDVRRATEQQADLEDPTGTMRQAVGKAWDAVGVGYGCTAPPAIPVLEVLDFLCRGRHSLSWAPVAGATTYFAEKVPLGWPWSLAQPTVDGPVYGCSQDNPSTFRIHLQSCNGCGCSSFGAAYTLQFYQPCL